MKLVYKPLLLSLLLSVAATTKAADNDHDDYVFRWTSTGGGWRAMFACMGFGNIFQQAGLLDKDHSHFSAISTNSGASWFSTQAFYSTAFYQKTVLAESPASLREFAREWMESYLSVAKNITEYDICDISDFMGGNSTTTSNMTESSPLLTVFGDFCNMLMEYDGDWTAFIDEMMTTAAMVYEDGATTFASRIANSGNRIRPLRGTDLLVQSAILANSRIRAPNNVSDDTTIHLGSHSTTDSLYSVTLSAAYTVNATYTGFQYNTGGTSNDNTLLQTHLESTSGDHSFRDFDDYNLYPPTVAASVEYTVDDNATSMGGLMREPFGGRDFTTVVQVAAVSSAAVGPFSPAGPSTFSQSLSKMRFAFEDDRLALTLFDRAADRLYQSPMLDKFAVCSQWPDPCGETDALLIDGGLVDNSALPINVAQYHLSGEPLDKTLKIVVTNTNEDGTWGTDRMNTQLLQYFATSLNEGVAPGDFIWFDALPLPFRSPQIFADSMDMDMLNALLEPIEGSSMTTAVIETTTIDNPAFGIRAGQELEILLINLNAPVTTFIVGPTIIEQMITPVSDMVHDIAANQELLARVQDFFGAPTQSTSTETLPPEDDTSAGGGSIPEGNLDSSDALSTTRQHVWSLLVLGLLAYALH